MGDIARTFAALLGPFTAVSEPSRLHTGRPLAAEAWIEQQEAATHPPMCPAKPGPKPKQTQDAVESSMLSLEFAMGIPRDSNGAENALARHRFLDAADEGIAARRGLV